ncbi:Dynein light chain 1 [Diplonema papillatum]|nr:Dynein light chain 1 [Diplonema papillatum]
MSLPPITVKEAIENWLDVQWEKNKLALMEKVRAQTERGNQMEYVEPLRPVAAEETDVRLFGGGNGKLPPIQKMDKELQTLKKCQILRLSTNCIEKIGPGLNALPNLEILSLGRNKIKKLENLDLPNLRELWISYNFIDKLSGLDKLRNLQVLYMSNNLVSKWTEVDKLSNCNSQLTDILMVNNPIYYEAVGSEGKVESSEKKEWRMQLLVRLPGLTKIDGEPVEPEEREEAEKRKMELMR